MKRELKIWAVIFGIIVVGIGITKFTDAYVSNKRRQMDIAGLAETRVGDAAEEFTLTAKSSAERAVAEEMRPGQETRQEERIQEREAAADTADGEAMADAADAGEVILEEALDAETREMESLEGARTSGSPAPAGGAGAGAAWTDGISEEDMTGGPGGEPALLAEIAEMGGQEDDAAADGDAADHLDKLEDHMYRLSELDAQIERMRSTETENTVQSVKSTAKMEQRIWERELEAVYSLLIVSLDEKEGDSLRAEQQAWIIERDIAAQEASRKNSGSMENVEYTASIAASTRERVYQLVERYR